MVGIVSNLLCWSRRTLCRAAINEWDENRRDSLNVVKILQKKEILYITFHEKVHGNVDKCVAMLQSFSDASLHCMIHASVIEIHRFPSLEKAAQSLTY